MGSQSAPGDARLGTGAGCLSFPMLNIIYAERAARGGGKKSIRAAGAQAGWWGLT